MRKAKRAQVELGGIELCHLALGDCLIAGGCALCDQVDDDPKAACPRVLGMELAEAQWRAHREAIVASWTLHLDQRGEPGLHGLPLFAEVFFDGKPLPQVRADWPEEVKARHTQIEANLAGLFQWLVDHV